ncbi:MAG TPA: peptidase, partial [Melioribacteraceae bacterium]|nr:peptidase [Melioribacteraceae bacterium]
MNRFFKYSIIIAGISGLLIGCKPKETKQETSELEIMKAKVDQFAEVQVNYDHNILDEKQKVVLQKLYEASKIMDEIFLEQVYHKNFEIKKALENSNDPVDAVRLQYFNIMFGPFDRLDHNKPFYGTETKPLGANFYPADITKEEFENYVKANPNKEKELTSEFTIIKREGKDLVAVPYSIAYKEKLEKAAKLLNEAADFAENSSLKKYLQLRAKAFLSNDYYESDVAWMDLKDHGIEVVIGPYEVYEDEMFNYKAAFESFLTIVDPIETKKLEIFKNYLDAIEENLPLAKEYKGYKRGSESPIYVVQEVFGAGDNKSGVQTLAFNLPNDERVRQAKGSKKVMLKNIHEAKFEKLLKPIAQLVLDEKELSYVTFNGFFNHTLMHEISHGVGPGLITKDGKKTEVKKELKETYSKIEECKADVLGMFNNILMLEKGVYPKGFDKEIYTTFLAGIFRSVRFGISEAHGSANAIIYNYLLEKGAYTYSEQTKKVSVNFDKINEGIKSLAELILTTQA